jgi:hypothetical protein
MRNKFLLFAIASALIGLSAFWFVPRASAQTPINTTPANAVYLDNQWHYIPPRTSLWFLFDYAGDRTIAEIILLDGNPKKLQFNVYSPAQISGHQDSTNPVGRGSAPQVNCDTGKCLSNHILWKSASPEGGTYMIEVVNENPAGMPYLLAIVGGSVTLRVPPPEPPAQLVPRTIPTPTTTLSTTTPITAPILPAPSLTPTATIAALAPMTETVITSTTLSGKVAFVLGSPMQGLAEYAQRWFSFGYPANPAQVEFSIPGGAESHLMMLLFVQEQNAASGNLRYIGEASAKPVPCSTGACPSRDLAWSGELSTPGVYYALVINNNPSPQSFEVIAIGTPR